MLATLATVAAAATLFGAPPPRFPDAKIILASVTLTGAGKSGGGPPIGQFVFPTGTNLLLVAATF